MKLLPSWNEEIRIQGDSNLDSVGWSDEDDAPLGRVDGEEVGNAIVAGAEADVVVGGEARRAGLAALNQEETWK